MKEKLHNDDHKIRLSHIIVILLTKMTVYIYRLTN